MADQLGKRGCLIVKPERLLFTAHVGQAAAESIEESDLVIADVSCASHGVGFEIGYAFAHRKRIILVCKMAARDSVSRVLLSLFPDIVFYEDVADLVPAVLERVGNAAK